MNIFSRFLRFSPKIRPNFLKTIKNSHKPLFFFSDVAPTLKKSCAHNKSDFYNLLAVTKKNQPKILETLKKYSDSNYICFLLQMAFELDFGTPEFFDVLIPKFLSLEITNPNIILNLYRGLPKAKPELFNKVVDKIQEALIKNLPVFRKSRINEILEINKMLPDPSKNQIPDKITQFLSFSDSERVQLYLKALKLDELLITEKNNWELVKIDIDNKEYRLLNKEHNQEIIICGCEPFPNENLDYVLNVIDSEKNQINLLIVQDIPILDKKFKDSNYSMEKRSSKKLAEYFKHKDFKDELEGGMLEWYAKSFINNEFFVMNLKEKKIYQKINSQLYIPSELGSTVVRFVQNAHSDINPKVILADYPLIFQIAKYNRNLSIEHCRDLIHICNYVNLLEKTLYSHSTYLLGCHKCNPQENPSSSPDRLPRDYLSVISGGDVLLPNKDKSDYVAKKIYKSVMQYPEHKKILVMVSSTIIEDILLNIFKVSQMIRLGSMENFSELANLKKSLEVFQEVDKDHLILEKTIIFEILFATFCMDMQKVNNEDPRTSIALQKYLDYQNYYRELFSYEALSDLLGDEEVVVAEEGESEEDDDDQQEKIYTCPSNVLVFGDKQGKPLIKKFHLNAEYKKHFKGSDGEIREIKKIYKEISEKTREKIQVVEENRKPQEKGGDDRKTRRKKKKNIDDIEI